MRRGTTPTIVIEIPERVPISEINYAVFSISQCNCEIIRKKLSDMTPDYKNNTYSITLSQEDTLKLRDGMISMQLKVKIGESVFASDIVLSHALEILNEDVI